jgi:hypothetical protein
MSQLGTIVTCIVNSLERSAAREAAEKKLTIANVAKTVHDMDFLPGQNTMTCCLYDASPQLRDISFC